MEIESRAQQRNKEQQDLEALINNMQDDEDDSVDLNQKVVLDPDLMKLGNDANKLLSNFGHNQVQFQDVPQYQQKAQKGVKSNDTNIEDGQKLRDKEIEKLEAQLKNMPDDGDDGDDLDYGKPVKIEMDPELQNLMKNCQNFSSQYGIEVPKEFEEKQNYNAPLAKPQASASGNNIIDMDNQYTVISQIPSVLALLGEQEFYTKYFVNNKTIAFQKHGKMQIDCITQMLGALSGKIQMGQLTAEKYAKVVKEKGDEQIKMWKKIENKSFKTRLSERCKKFQIEIQASQKNAQAHLDSIVLKLPVTGKPVNHVYEIDTKPHREKVQEIAKRNIHYFNFYKYHVQNQYRMDYSDAVLKPLLQEFKDLLGQLKEGKNVKIGRFLEEKAPELNLVKFHGMPEQSYQAKIRVYISEFEKVFTIGEEFPGNSAVKQAEESKMKIDKYNIDIVELENMEKKFVFIPIPQIAEKIETRNIRVSNSEIEKFQMKVVFKRLVNAKPDKYSVHWSVEANKAIFSDKTDWCNKGMVFQDYSKTIVIGDRKNPYNEINKKQISLNIYSKGFFSDSFCNFSRVVGQATINLQPLETKASIDSAVDIVHKGRTFQLEYGVYIREPVAAGANQGGKTKAIQIVKSFPTFDMTVGVEKYVQDKLNETKEPEPEVEDKKMEEEVQQKENDTKMEEEEEKKQEPELPDLHLPVLEHNETHPDIVQLKSLGSDQIPPGLTLDNIVNPENPSHNVCMLYLKIFTRDLEAGCVKFGEEKKRVERRIARSLNDAVLKEIILIEKAGERNEIDPQTYYQGLAKMIARDKKLITFYQTRQGLTQKWHEFPQARINIVQYELDQSGVQVQQVDENQKQTTSTNENKMQEEQAPQGKLQPKKVDQEADEPPQLDTYFEVLEHDLSHPDIIFLASIPEDKIPKGLNKEIIMNPENPKVTPCTLYFQQFQKDLTAAAAYYGQVKKRNERKLVRNLNDSIMSAEAKMKKDIQTQEMDEDDYKEGLQLVISRDQKLAEFYKSCPQLKQNWVNFVTVRKQVAEKELAGEQSL